MGLGVWRSNAISAIYMCFVTGTSERPDLHRINDGKFAKFTNFLLVVRNETAAPAPAGASATPMPLLLCYRASYFIPGV